MKISNILLLITAAASSCNAVCCYYGQTCDKRKRDEVTSPLPLELRYYHSEEYVPEGAANVFDRRVLGSRTPAVCCCSAANANACDTRCEVSSVC